MEAKPEFFLAFRFLFAFVCFPFSRRNCVKLQSPNYPARSWINNNNEEEERAQNPPRNHGNPQLGTKQTLLQHTRTHNTQNLPPPENAACYCCCCYTKEKKLRAQSVRGEEPGGVQLGAGLKNSPKHFHKLRFALIYTRCCCCYFCFSSSVSKHSPERVGREPRKAKNQLQMEEPVRWFRTTAASVAGRLR